MAGLAELAGLAAPDLLAGVVAPALLGAGPFGVLGDPGAVGDRVVPDVAGDPGVGDRVAPEAVGAPEAGGVAPDVPGAPGVVPEAAGTAGVVGADGVGAVGGLTTRA